MSPAQQDRFRRLAAQARKPWPAAWKWDEDGEVVVGEFVGVTRAPGNYGPVPVATLRLEDGTERAVWLSSQPLFDAFKREAPHVGDLVAVYRGEERTSAQGRRYRSWRVAVERDEQGLDWAALDAPAEEPGAGDEDVPW